MIFLLMVCCVNVAIAIYCLILTKRARKLFLEIENVGNMASHRNEELNLIIRRMGSKIDLNFPFLISQQEENKILFTKINAEILELRDKIKN